MASPAHHIQDIVRSINFAVDAVKDCVVYKDNKHNHLLHKVLHTNEGKCNGVIPCQLNKFSRTCFSTYSENITECSLEIQEKGLTSPFKEVVLVLV